MSGDRNGLPPGWAMVPLKSLVTIGRGNVEPNSEPNRVFNYVALENVSKGTGKLVGFEPTDGRGIGSTKAVFREGDVLYGKLRPYLQKAAVAPFDGVSATDLIPLVPGPGIEARYLQHFLLGPQHLDYISPLLAGIRMPRLRKGDIERMPFPIPGSNEQKRIVAKIEALQERSGAANEAIDAIPPLLEKFRRSVLAAAFRGDLTKAWRAKNPGVEPAHELLERIRAERRHRWEATKPGKKYNEPSTPDTANGTPDVPSSWAVVSVAEVTECLDSIRRPVTRKDRKPGPYPYFGANGQVDTVAEFLFDEELVLVTEDETFYGRTKPIAYRVSGKCWVNNHAHVLRAVSPVSPDYLCQSLMYYNVIPWLSGTTGRAKLTQGAMNALPIALSPAEEMVVIASRVRKLLDFAAAVQETVAGLAEPSSKLTQSILAKAFRGELVPQDPNDEPASVLLERIRAEREASDPKAKKRGRGPKTANRQKGVK